MTAAALITSSENKISDENDVFWGFLEHSKEISNEEMQRLIAKIIAGEYNSPGTYSMSALPQIFSGFRVAISLSLIIVIVTEMFIGTEAGLGKRIIDAQLVYQTADMYAAILMTSVMGFLLNKIMMFIENRVVHWKGK